jgi:hypothetical protein
MNKFKDMSSGFQALWASFILSAAWFVFYNVGVYSALVIVSGLIFIYIFPLIYLLNDSTLSKENKSGWLILTIFFSWISFAFYLIKKNNK